MYSKPNYLAPLVLYLTYVHFCQFFERFLFYQRLKLRFSRKRETGDKQDVSFTDDEGMYLIFPVKGGSFNSVNKKLKKHEITPIASTERILIKSCRSGASLE